MSMRAAKGKKRVVIVAAATLLAVLLVLPAGAALPRSADVADLIDIRAPVAHIAPTIAPASILPATSALIPRAGPARARLRVHIAPPPSWPFSPARVGAFGRLEPKTRVWGFGFGLSEQPLRNQWFRPRIAEGVHNGPSQYQFANYSPANYTDPLGLTSRSDIHSGRLIYVWNLGWLDRDHMATNVLDEPWKRLKAAGSGEVVTFSIALKQKEAGEMAYKQSKAAFRIIAAPTEHGRARQLLATWMSVSEQFEEFQGEGIQGLQIFNSLLGLRKLDQKVGSSFSTEDLVSNLVAFHSTVGGLSWQEFVGRFGQELSAEDQVEFSSLLWDCAGGGLRMNGNRKWEPIYARRNAGILSEGLPGIEASSDPVGYFRAFRGLDYCDQGRGRYHDLFDQYRSLYGAAQLPAAMTMRPLFDGVSVVGTPINRGNR